MSASPAAGCVAPLFVPGHRPERFAKAAAAAATIIIDLEDAVPPEAKAAARQALAGPLPAAAILVRVNGVGTPWHGDDLAMVDQLGPAGLLLPKAERAGDVAALAARHAVVALIETAAGLAAAREIARAGATRLAFGSVDFSADLGCAHAREPLLLARCELVLASRLAGLPPPLDGVTLALDDPAAVLADARHAAALGFGGKLCIHPAQIAPALEGFAPTAEELAWARRVLAGDAGGAAALDGLMIDPPVRARAERLLARVGH